MTETVSGSHVRAGPVTPQGGSGVQRGTEEDSIQAAFRLRKRWQAGEPPDLTKALALEPTLREHPTLVIELAYEEYQYRLRAGESLTAEEFAQRIPWLKRSLCMYIAIQTLIGTFIPSILAPDQCHWPEPGRSFLGFELLRELGRGTFARVYQASETAIGNRCIVLKVAWQGGHEAAILGRLRHPNIVPIYSIQEDDGTGLTGFCMPFFGQATLLTVIDRLFSDGHLPLSAKGILRAIQISNVGMDLPVPVKPSDPIFQGGTFVEGAVHIAIQLAEALAHAHSRGIYHRDLKPSNVLMSPEAEPLLLDFNLSIDEALPIGRVGGTLPYMSPEELANLGDRQSNEKTRPFDPRSDLFSLGVILYELLTGNLPYGTLPNCQSLEETVDILRGRQMQGPIAIETQNPQVERRLAAIVGRMLAVDPEQRFLDAGQVAGALRDEIGLLPRMRRRLMRHRRKVIAGATTVIILIASLGMYLAFRPPYAVRQLRSGIAYFKAGDFDLAADCLTKSLDADPSSCEAYLARARLWKKRHNYKAAVTDFDKANTIQFNPLATAEKAYCLNIIGEKAAAAECYRQALGSDGSSAIVWNDLGFSYLQLGEFAEAEKCLDRAIVIDEKLQAAHWNMVVLFIKQNRSPASIHASILSHAKRALEIGPETGDLDQLVATLYAMAARNDKQWTEPAIRLAAQAIAQGIPRKRFLSDPVFSTLPESGALVEAVNLPRDSVVPPQNANRLLDPLP